MVSCRLVRLVSSATVLVETSSTGATGILRREASGSSCLVDRTRERNRCIPRPAGVGRSRPPAAAAPRRLVGALGAALCAMVARITRRQRAAGRACAPHGPGARPPTPTCLRGALRRRPAPLRRGRVRAGRRRASALPKAGEAANGPARAALQAALVGATEAPLAAAGMCAEGIALAARDEAELGNTHLVSDVECALHFFRAALAAGARTCASTIASSRTPRSCRHSPSG